MSGYEQKIDWQQPVRLTVDVSSSQHRQLHQLAETGKVTLKEVCTEALRQILDPDVKICTSPEHLPVIGRLLQQAQRHVLVLGSTMAEVITQNPDLFETIKGKAQERLVVKFILEPKQTSLETISMVRSLIKTGEPGFIEVSTLKKELPYEAVMVDSFFGVKAAIIQLNLDKKDGVRSFFLAVRGDQMTPLLRQYTEFVPGALRRGFPRSKPV